MRMCLVDLQPQGDELTKGPSSRFWRQDRAAHRLPQALTKCGRVYAKARGSSRETQDCSRAQDGLAAPSLDRRTV